MAFSFTGGISIDKDEDKKEESGGAGKVTGSGGGNSGVAKPSGSGASSSGVSYYTGGKSVGEGNSGPSNIDLSKPIVFDFKSGLSNTEPEPETSPEPEATPEPEVYNPPESGGEEGGGSEAQESAAAEPVQPQVQTPAAEAEAETEERASGEKRADAQAPIVYTGGGTTTPAGTGSKGTGASGTKTALEEEEEEQGLPAAFWDWTAEEQQEYLANPRNQATAKEQANRQARENLTAADIVNNMPKVGNGNFSFTPPAPGTQPAVTPQQSGETAAQRAGAYQAAWQRRNADIQQRLAMQNYQYDPLQAAILRANAGLGGSGLETRGYDPGVRLANDQQYLADNGFSWAGNPSLQSEDRGGTYVPPTAEGQEDYDTQVRILKDRGYSQEDAERMAAEEFGPYTYSGDQPSYERVDVPKGTADPADVRQGYYQEGYREAMAQNMSEADAMRYAENYATEKTNALQKAGQMTDAERARRNPNASYYYAPIPGTGTGSNTYAGPEAGTPAGNQTPAMTEAQRRFEQEEAAGMWNTEVPAADTRIPGTETYQPNTNRPGADAALEGIMETTDRGPLNKPDSVLFAEQAAAKRNAGTGTGTGAGSGNGNNGKLVVNQGAGPATKAGTKAGTGTNSGSGSDVPKGSQYFRPSYGQDMKKGVKAPYRKGGYSAEELEKMGNAPRTDFKYNNGKTAYEGYYLAPDNQYYPIDQDKARYYLQTGSYKGWEEGMRDYWNNFGTFYGYRPDWKTAGGKNVWKQNSGRSSGGGRGGYSYSGGGSGGGSGRSYGGGSTANNGLYWNPNTSWSI